jgi:hypothetical protein
VLDQAEKWTQFLQTTGGWGVAVVFMGICLKLYLDNRKRDAKVDQLLEKRHDQFVELMEEATTTMRSVTDFLTRHEPTFPKIQVMLERLERTIQWCESAKRGSPRTK